LEVTHSKISEYLSDFIKRFPIEAIPHKTEDERNIHNLRRIITNIRVKIGYLRKDFINDNKAKI
jgi:hypothetical protein